MSHRSIRTFMFLARVALATPLVFAAAHAVAQWKPEGAVELIATNAPGGGSDRILRLMQKIMQDQGSPVPINVVNKPGGGSAIAYTYVNQHPGDARFFVLASKSLLTNNIVGRGPSYTTMTPIAHLFNEYIAVTVTPDSPIKTGKDMIDRLKKDPQAVSFGIATSLGAPNHSGVAAAASKAGIDVKKLRAVIFASGGAATTALFGGHIDVVPISVAFATSLLRNGQVRIIAIAAPQRLPGDLAQVPTWREQGYDAVVSQWRGFVGPKDLTAAQVGYWEQAFRRFLESPEWKKELDTNFWQADFRNGAGFRKVLDEDNVELSKFLNELGLVKKK
ncbi:MAG: tripartite tricarboxylate transporter substrate binding protein [Betaproteobacteria bacterium]|nr:tripartite tricarboxylate transporter substrate binding protein [Betaproteobacteria bacterium]